MTERDERESSEGPSEEFKERQERRRQRLRSVYDQTKRRGRFRHEPPPDPEEWEPKPWWKHSARVLLETPAGLTLLILFIALVLYWLLPHLP